MKPKQLRAAISALGLSQVAFARLYGVNPRTVRSWLQGRRKVPGWLAQALSDREAAKAASA